MKDFFFDRPAVIAAVGKRAAGAIIRVGGYIRTAARNSMRDGFKNNKRGKRTPSPAGKPPKAWVRTMKDKLFFAWDKSKGSVVIGPEYVKMRSQRMMESQPIPHLHEHGGLARKYDRKGRPSTKRYPARPYMRPALDKSWNRPVLQKAFDEIAYSIGPTV